MIDEITIAPTGLPVDGFEDLIGEARAERVAFLARMSAEWQRGKSRYDGKGEILLGAFDGARLVGICGLVRDPFLENPMVGRLRHLFVSPSVRGRGVGSALARAILDHAQRNFAIVRLRTDEEVRGAFYASFGFRPIEDESATHQIRFG